MTFLQYVNPMAMNCWAISRASNIKTVGLCHSVQGTAGELARDIGVPIDQINYLCAGINHMAFYLRFERDGRDLYPQIRQVAAEGRAPDWNLVRYEMLKRMGYFVTESSEHFSEYTPWFIKRDRPDLIEEFNVPLDEYIRRCETPDRRLGEYAHGAREPRPPGDRELRAGPARGASPARRGQGPRARRGAAQGVGGGRAQQAAAPLRRVRLADHPRHGDRPAARDLRQPAQPRPDRQPAAGLLRRGAGL